MAGKRSDRHRLPHATRALVPFCVKVSELVAKSRTGDRFEADVVAAFEAALNRASAAESRVLSLRGDLALATAERAASRRELRSELGRLDLLLTSRHGLSSPALDQTGLPRHRKRGRKRRRRAVHSR